MAESCHEENLNKLPRPALHARAPFNGNFQILTSRIVIQVPNAIDLGVPTSPSPPEYARRDDSADEDEE
eukprot:CAMPEP_0113591728 /NCGR_PEP_ID=MMETSP0015_2-20120614/37435_1 /TAXON_ID=2838 /ORGANISM="Odontella" /LENGTH=68 /DNA_ID=CAMNT_0000498151 /DNA_START=60 /DNA_END=267 /DNA_ORIENTATION=- /assembly_acc=CAM_ASM_000160